MRGHRVASLQPSLFQERQRAGEHPRFFNELNKCMEREHSYEVDHTYRPHE